MSGEVGYTGGFTLFVVLFILLIIVGAGGFSGQGVKDNYCYGPESGYGYGGY